MLCKITNLSKSFSSPEKNATIDVLCTISFSIDRGQSIAITGPSGSGKTTLLNCIATLEQPDSGSVQLDDNEISQLPDDRLARLRSQKIGIVFQQHYLLPYCTLLENILIPTIPWPDKINRKKLLERALYLIERVGLKERLHHRPSQLSGGECQRGAVVRALINAPSLLCADEPTGSLDRATAESIGELLVALGKEEKTGLIVVTHSDRLAARMERRFQLDSGILVQSGNNE